MIIGSSPQPSPKERELGIRIGEILNPFDDYWDSAIHGSKLERGF
jgi:hypothetical protein